MSRIQHPALSRVLEQLDDRLASQSSSDRVATSPQYTVPGLWVDPNGPVASQVVAPIAFFRDRLQEILRMPARAPVMGGEGPGDWSEHAVAYNLCVRAGAAWRHAPEADDRVHPGPRVDGWRETGTFLKAITFLPFIRSLGCNTVHLLPVTAIGRDGHKGALGSLYAIRDPYALDENLSEPALGLGSEAEFAAFVEAAHHLGLRVVLEFVFRTAAKDSVWAAEHPEWFYWIRAEVPDRQPGALTQEAFGAPFFSPSELGQIYLQVGTGQHADLPAPHPVYRRMFLPPPAPDEVELVDGGWLGRVRDPETGEVTFARIPGAFSDWTPDSDQPPWSDVTYLRMYDHPDFNYMAYNTVRIYDTRLAQSGNAVRPLWDKIVEIIPHYQAAFGIDGVMIDMGHALPVALKQRLVARAREANADFALWAEDFDLKPSSRAEGYNACLGPFMQTVRDPVTFAHWLDQLQGAGVPVPFMATPENHNTPRAVTWPGGLKYAIYAMTIGALLPSVPTVHGGLELAETLPVNTGFDFSPEQLAGLPADVLPLFSAASYDWTREPNLVAALRAITALRECYEDLVGDPSPGSIRRVETSDTHVIAFLRGGPGKALLVLCNSDMSNPHAVRVVTRDMGPIRGPGIDDEILLAPAQVRIIEIA